MCFSSRKLCLIKTLLLNSHSAKIHKTIYYYRYSRYNWLQLFYNIVEFRGEKNIVVLKFIVYGRCYLKKSAKTCFE